MEIWEVTGAYATEIDGNTVFIFDSGDMLIVDNITIAALSDDIVIF